MTHVREWLRRFLRSQRGGAVIAWRSAVAAAAWIWRALAPETKDEALLYLAIGLLAYGGGMVWAPAAALVPGAILLWLALPKREGFIHRESAGPVDPGARRKA